MTCLVQTLPPSKLVAMAAAIGATLKTKSILEQTSKLDFKPKLEHPSQSELLKTPTLAIEWQRKLICTALRLLCILKFTTLVLVFLFYQTSSCFVRTLSASLAPV